MCAQRCKDTVRISHLVYCQGVLQHICMVGCASPAQPSNYLERQLARNRAFSAKEVSFQPECKYPSLERGNQHTQMRDFHGQKGARTHAQGA